MKTVRIFLLAALAHMAMAQESPIKPNLNDPFFPSRGQFNAGLITTYTGTTPPPVLIADVTYGISNKLSMGLVGGTTGTLALLGMKLNTVLYQRKNFRSIFRMAMIYYPERNGTFLLDNKPQQVMAWMFTFGVVDAEWKTKKGVRFSLGMGMLETHCIDDMQKWFRSEQEAHPVVHQETHQEDHVGSESMIEVFNTLNTGISIPVSKRLTIRPEVIVAMRGLRIIELHEFKVNPVSPYINFVYSFGHRGKK